ncbi:MAG TPA: hypothetical protein VMI34_04520 [Candidatus Bathyarchaeia archaeon]|nr:hypothetical protein [Candidatus Bathyarchaeia archaeon]
MPGPGRCAADVDAKALALLDARQPGAWFRESFDGRSQVAALSRLPRGTGLGGA